MATEIYNIQFNTAGSQRVIYTCPSGKRAKLIFNYAYVYQDAFMRLNYNDLVVLKNIVSSDIYIEVSGGGVNCYQWSNNILYRVGYLPRELYLDEGDELQAYKIVGNLTVIEEDK